MMTQFVPTPRSSRPSAQVTSGTTSTGGSIEAPAPTETPRPTFMQENGFFVVMGLFGVIMTGLALLAT